MVINSQLFTIIMQLSPAGVSPRRTGWLSTCRCGFLFVWRKLDKYWLLWWGSQIAF